MARHLQDNCCLTQTDVTQEEKQKVRWGSDPDVTFCLAPEYNPDTPTFQDDTYQVFGPKPVCLTSLMTHLSAPSGTEEWVNTDSSYLKTARMSLPDRMGAVITVERGGVTKMTDANNVLARELNRKVYLHRTKNMFKINT